MSKIKKEEEQSNKWIKRFFILLSINIGTLFILLILLFWPAKDVEIPADFSDLERDSSEFIVRTTKQNLNNLINAYIQQMSWGSKYKYQIHLEDDVHLIGELPVFSSTVPLSIHFEPFVANNGDIILQQRSIALGLLKLPNKKIMEYLDEYLPMPDWVIVDAENEEIYIAVTQMDIKSNFKLAVETIDLEANNLAFKISVPYDTLRIEGLKLLD